MQWQRLIMLIQAIAWILLPAGSCIFIIIPNSILNISDLYGGYEQVPGIILAEKGVYAGCREPAVYVSNARRPSRPVQSLPAGEAVRPFMR